MENSRSTHFVVRLLLAVVSALVLVAPRGMGAEKPSCAVLTFAHGSGVSPSETVLLTRKYTDALDALGTYKLVSYRRMNSSLSNAGFGARRYSSNLERAMAAGRTLDVDFLVFGTTYAGANGSNLRASLLDVRSGQRIRAVVTSARGTVEKMASLIATDNISKLVGETAAWPMAAERYPARKSMPVYEDAAGRTGADGLSDLPSPAGTIVRSGEGERWSFLPEMRGLQWPRFGASGEEFRYELSASIVRIEDREMKEKGGLEDDPRYKHFRASSGRFLIDADVIWRNRYRFRGTLGMADLELHSSEGSGWELDSAFAYGISAGALLYRMPSVPLEFHASVGYFAFSADGSLSSVDEPIHGYTEWESLSVDWSEIDLSAWARYSVTDDCRLNGGGRLIKVSGDESGTGNGVHASGDLDEEDSFGLFVALEYDVIERLGARFQANFMDSTELRATLFYQF